MKGIEDMKKGNGEKTFMEKAASLIVDKRNIVTVSYTHLQAHMQDMPMPRQSRAEYPKTNSAPTNRLPPTNLQHSRSVRSATTTQTAISTLTAL